MYERTINISSVKLFIGTKNIYTYLHIELWKCDWLKATTDNIPDEDWTRDPSAQGLIPYQLPQSTSHALGKKTEQTLSVKSKRSYLMMKMLYGYYFYRETQFHARLDIKYCQN